MTNKRLTQYMKKRKKHIFLIHLIYLFLSTGNTALGIETPYLVDYTMERSAFNTSKEEDGISLLADSFVYSSTPTIINGRLREKLDFDTVVSNSDWSNWSIEGQFTQTPKGSIIFSHRGKLYIAKAKGENLWENPKKLKIEGMEKKRITLRGSSMFYRSWRYPKEDAIVMYNPHLSKDGKRLYYASNYYGTKGNLDIWYSILSNENEEEWNEPINLGDSVNSTSNEDYPFIHENMLYFSSERKDSLKGRNLYKYNFSTQKRLFLPEPFNSNSDDYNMIGDGKYLFLVSNREGNPDIYYPKKIKKDSVDSTLIDSIDNQLANEGNVLANEGSKDNEKNINFNPTEEDTKKIEMPDINTCILYFIFDEDNFISDYKKEIEIIMNFIDFHKGADFKITGHTDSRGSITYNQKLSERRAEKLKRILIEKGVEGNRLQTIGRSELELVIPQARNEKEHQLNRRVVIEKIEK